MVLAVPGLVGNNEIDWLYGLSKDGFDGLSKPESFREPVLHDGFDNENVDVAVRPRRPTRMGPEQNHP